MLFISGLALVVLFVVGLSCVSYDEGTTDDDWSSWDEERFKDFITLDSSAIVECLQDLDPLYEGDPADQPTQDGFDAIRDWVAANIEYETDEDQWGVDEYWQTPEETLSLRTGDCEDFAILLCALLRTYGIGAEHIYVAIGVDNKGYGHAFLTEDWYLDEEWQAIEPQVEAEPFRPGQRFKDFNLVDFLLLRHYEIMAAFNDFYYYDESFPWDID
jgi:hypothetical protein